MTADNEGTDALPALDRAAHLRKDLDFLQAELRAGSSLILPVWRDLTLVDGPRVTLLPVAEAGSLLDHDGELVWLGKLGERSCFALDVGSMGKPLEHPALRARGELQDLRMIGGTLPADHAWLAAYARGLIYWHGRHRHCGVCGAPTHARQGGHIRVCRNEACAVEHFPRTDPAVIVLVYHGEHCLLGRQARFPKGMYSTLAGFVEPGESVEQAVVREIEEESGVRVTDVKYFRSQPWPFPASLMLGYTARALSPEIRIDQDELEDCRWFTREQVRSPREHGFFVPGTFSLSGQLLAAFLAGE